MGAYSQLPGAPRPPPPRGVPWFKPSRPAPFVANQRKQRCLNYRPITRTLPDDRAARASDGARSRKHPHPARGGRAGRAPGTAVLDRQGLLRPAASGAQGVLPGPAAVPAAAYRHDVEVPRHDPPPRRDGAAIRAGADRPHQPGRRAAEHQPVRPRQQLHPDHEDRRAEAGADRRPLRPRHRRRPARRGTLARQGTRLLGPRPRPHLGAEAPAAGTLASVQRQPRARRDAARVPAVELDRTRRVDLHPGGRHRRRAAVFRRRAPHRRRATAR